MSVSTSVRIALAEDQLLMRKAMVELLEQEEDFEIVFEASNGADLVSYIKHGKADLVLSDLEMPKMGGMEVIRQLKQDRPDIPVMILSAHESEETVLEALQAGAKGYLLKNSSPTEVKKAIRSVRTSGFYIRETISQLLMGSVVNRELLKPVPDSKQIFTPRESEILALICQEYTNKEIALQLGLSQRTVESYRKNMLEKVAAKNTIGLVLHAVKKGLIQLE